MRGEGGKVRGLEGRGKRVGGQKGGRVRGQEGERAGW